MLMTINDVKPALFEAHARAPGCELLTGRQEIRIGYRSYANPGTIIRQGTHIGRYCSIGRRCSFNPGEHSVTRLSTHPFVTELNRNALGLAQPSLKPASQRFDGTVIGNDVWIGDHVIVMSNVRVGDGAVLAAGAVVTKDVEPYTIVGGVPAKVIRKRFSDDVIVALLEIKWWDYEESLITGVPVNDITSTIAILRSRIASGAARILAPHYKPT